MFNKIIKNKASLLLFLFSLLFLLGGTLWVYFSLSGASGPLILSFNDQSGINMVGGLVSLIFFSITGFILWFINLIIAIQLEERDLFLSRLVGVSSLLLSFLIFIGFASIISVN